MPITDRTRKALWGKSGNRCAICRGHLVLEGTAEDREALVGDECHIVAQSPGGPRAVLGAKELDSYSNFILLCKSDHKRIDDQPGEFTPERLRAIKRDHEAWVQGQLDRSGRPEVTFYQAPSEKNGVDLIIVPDGNFLLRIVSGCVAGYYDSEPARSEEEVELIGGFLRQVRELDEMLDDDLGDRVGAEFELTNAIKELNEGGFVVYAGRLDRTIKVDGDRSPWPVSVVNVVRNRECEVQESYPA